MNPRWAWLLLLLVWNPCSLAPVCGLPFQKAASPTPSPSPTPVAGCELGECLRA